MRELILVASPPACGKTRLSKRLSNDIGNVVYLDKDSLIPLSKRIFKVGHKPFNRSSAFFNREIRDTEYEVIVNIAIEALKYNDRVIINAPFTKEIRDKELLKRIIARIKGAGGELFVVWIQSNAELCYKRMKKRNSERDVWKLKNWDEYVKSVDFSAPEIVGGTLFIYDSTTEEKAEEDYERLLNELKR